MKNYQNSYWKNSYYVKIFYLYFKQYNHLSPKITGECRFDGGGYFIINGSEKTCLGQERAAENNIMCFNVKKNNNKWSWLAEIKSIPDDKCISPKQINITIATRNNGSRSRNLYSYSKN